MNSHTYIWMPGHFHREDWLSWSQWLPGPQQMWDAGRLNVHDAVDPWEKGRVTVSMRQGVGMIFVLGLLAGVIPLISNLWLAVPMQTSVPMAQLGDSASQMLKAYAGIAPLDVAGHTAQTVASLEPRMPGIFAALLSAIGVWLNWPLSWLANWILYGAAVFAIARLIGATNTLQPFFAATSFAAVPLVLTGLAPVPWIGPLFVLAGFVLAAVVYFKTFRFATQLDAGRTHRVSTAAAGATRHRAAGYVHRSGLLEYLPLNGKWKVLMNRRHRHIWWLAI